MFTSTDINLVVHFLFILFLYVNKVETNIYFRYDTKYLKFGKIDISRYPDAANKYHISDSSLSRQLPTVIMFKNGVEELRRPTYDSKGKIFKFFFTEVCILLLDIFFQYKKINNFFYISAQFQGSF